MAMERRPLARQMTMAQMAQAEKARVVVELSADGMTPLQIMVDTMRDLWVTAQRAPDDASRLMAKMQACAVAEKAAPYMHAKLHSAEVNVRKVTDVRELSADELDALIASAGTDEAIEGEVLPHGIH